jgi:hypothetical protein
MDRDEPTGGQRHTEPNDDKSTGGTLLSLRAALIVSVAVLVGILIGHTNGPQAGCSTGVALAATLHQFIGRKE